MESRHLAREGGHGASPEKGRLLLVSTLLKLACCASLCLLALVDGHMAQGLVGMLEVLVIFALTLALMGRGRLRMVAQLLNDAMVLLVVVQLAVLHFAGSYVTMVMLANVDSIEDLAGNAGPYLAAAAAAIAICLLPVAPRAPRRPLGLSLLALLLAEAAAVTTMGPGGSPLLGCASLVSQARERAAYVERLSRMSDTSSRYFRPGLDSHVSREDNLPKRPNVILIFTEGLSQEVIDDERDVMSNVRSFQGQSVSFENYYNHSFATYRGLSGQLFSGYQYDNYDANALVSLPQALSGLGYATRFINTEPNNEQFTDYLGTLGFDEVVGEPGTYSGMAASMSDGEAYERLFDLAEELEGGDEPFFAAIYTFGTHASLDSVDRRFGDGGDAVLNKFHDAGHHFGRFMERFLASGMADDTIVVFTADHASFAERGFVTAFPEPSYRAEAISDIPFFIYHKGVVRRAIDAGGRNSLDLAPTLMDYLGLSAPNFFLGTSLFEKDGNLYDTTFYDVNATLSTRGGVVSELDEDRAKQFEEGLSG